MRLSLRSFLISCAIAGFLFADGKRDYKIIMKKCQAIALHPDIVSRANCSVSQVASDPDHTVLNGVMVLAKNVTNFGLRLTFDLLRKDNTKINLLSLDIDGCKFLDAIYGQSILRNVLQELRRKSNLPQKCPVINHIPYTMNGFVVNEEDYPPILPSLSFVFYSKFYINQAHEGDLTITGRVKRA